MHSFSCALNETHSVYVPITSVYVIKVEVDEIKQRLNEVLKHYNTLEKRIEADGPHFLQNVVKPIAMDDV
jgi:hypothetical protein